MAGVIGKSGSVHLFAQEQVLPRKQPKLLPYRVARTNLKIYEPTYPGKTLIYEIIKMQPKKCSYL